MTRLPSERPLSKSSPNQPPHPPPPAGPGPLTQVSTLQRDAAGLRAADQMVCQEAPVEIRLNGRSQVILMATPMQLEELALGYCVSEGVVQEAAQVQGLGLGAAELPAVGPAHWVDVTLAPELARAARTRRVAPAATSCGLCGLESLQELPDDLTPLPAPRPLTELAGVFRLLAGLEAAQALFARTGGAHAAALGRADGALVSVAEDIGRHNALDKALGIAHRAGGWDPARGLAVLSGRMSYEMAMKIARAGIPVVASVSAPTGLCVRLLQQLNITLIAFCRPPRATIFTHPERIIT
ncbi:MAG: formate dehydrogenase accessory sulfurtransferase FdhD [Pseudomonadota bacterium]